MRLMFTDLILIQTRSVILNPDQLTAEISLYLSVRVCILQTDKLTAPVTDLF